MENQNITAQQLKGIGCTKLLGKLFLGGYMLMFVIAIVLLSPWPFIRPLWRANILRWQMYEAVSHQVTGMSKGEVLELLGTPQHTQPTSYAYSMGSPWQRWQHLIILFDGNGIVRRVWRGHPAHSGFFADSRRNLISTGCLYH